MKFFGLVLSAAVALAIPSPYPVGIPSASTARSQLNGLKVSVWTNTDTYDRDLFKHWSAIEGNCNGREYVLKRDGTNVVVDNSCAATSGTWISPYDGARHTSASSIQIDHMVPLSNAWKSGAATWTNARREQFANDVTRPQLWAVTGTVNSAKGDKSPDLWKPPLTSIYCDYSKSWVTVKSYYGLTVTTAEKTALSSMLDYC